MQETIIKLEGIKPIDLYGANNSKFDFIKKKFPKLKIIERGDSIKVLGSETDILYFEEKLQLFIDHFNKYQSLTDNNILNLMGDDGKEIVQNGDGSDVLVFGNNGIKVKARTVNQRKIVSAFEKNDMVFAIGPAGTGKTYTAVALAVRALKNKEVKRIILTRPAVEAGENLGFLPGDLKEKLDPYLQPLYDGLRDMIPHEKLQKYFEEGIIQIAPLAFMRGRTLDHAFVILDEAQNATSSQIKMFLTRMGESAKFAITGDVTQVDLPKHQQSGLINALKYLHNIDGIKIVKLDQKDVIRHQLVVAVINAFEKGEKK